jgi:hypothetical protein
MLTSHPYVQYALLTALYLLFRLDPQSAQAAAAALPLWEVLHPALPRQAGSGRAPMASGADTLQQLH